MNELPLSVVKQTLDYIQEHLSEEISLEAIANRIGISRYYLSHLFKQSMGISLYQYVLQQRVECAKQLLKQSELSIAEIALECGFANQTHLAKHFRNLAGTSPKVYRNSSV
ncbi:helix-turn-helix transcriptional regulator [Oculatella sp. FACHB-28]|uniref:helix-turn-helix domain-containing protein n=1 Tax=Cyanophyceae TaxID=3028117 RepID=UPI0016830474|nr:MULTISPECIES: AraC family transcriptional regulator [Cyanophyceae]MBD1998936.1 helix-turn-helix transcriptional regulator [Leptolyngbya sp. FACHB-541]MBD2058169.1 helix-turn-helix transcriptional regulator [Oculatella sp. FACHB-28]